MATMLRKVSFSLVEVLNIIENLLQKKKIANNRKSMTELAEKRINFIAQLHEVFLVNKGYGAFAYITLNEVLDLFDSYLKSGESAEIFINRYVKSFR